MNFRRKRLRFSAAFLALALLDLFGPVVMSQHKQVAPASVSSLSAPPEVVAGSVVSIDAVAHGQSGVADVIVHTSFGRMTLAMDIESGVGHLDLPAALTRQAGVVTLTSGDALATFTVAPGEVAELVAPLVGPRTIVADGADTSLAVILPVDQYGNQVADGTTVDVEWQQPAHTGSSPHATQRQLATTDGMAWVLVPSGQVAGPTTIRSTSRSSAGENINAAAVRIDEVPGVANQIAISAVSDDGTADGRSLIEIESERLVDSFGNELLDGTSAQFLFDGPTGQGVVPGTVQNGVVRLELVAPTSAGTITGRLSLQGMHSNELAIRFDSAIASFDAAVVRIGSDAVLRVESAVDASGAFVADGTEVVWGEQTAQTRRGAAEIRLPNNLVGNSASSVEILGLEQPVVVR